jgi:hypothetical protein
MSCLRKGTYYSTLFAATELRESKQTDRERSFFPARVEKRWKAFKGGLEVFKACCGPPFQSNNS